jgi:uncharacterized protein (DUF362 family)
MSQVAITHGSNPVEATVEALELVKSDVNNVLANSQQILIKPNYIKAEHPSTGITTDSRVIEGVVTYLKAHDVNNIIIGEGSGFADTYHAFTVAGVDKVARRWNVKLLDLNNDEFTEVSPPQPLALKTVKVAKTAVESTIISVPKLKLHRMATVTLSLKNMMGVLADKGTMHRGQLSKNIVDLASIVRPHIAVIDGIIAGEGTETSGNPVEMNLVIAGTDPVAVDTVGAATMGVSPSEVKHLHLAAEKGLGTDTLDNITILGEPIENVTRKFRRSLSSKLLTYLG